MASTKGHFLATREWTDHMDNVIGCVELRIHFSFSPDCEAQTFGPAERCCPGQPDEIEFDFVEREVADFFGRNPQWVRIQPGMDHAAMIDGDGMIEWAEKYLKENHTEVYEDIAAMRADAEEYRAECRRDQLMMEK